MKFVKSSLLVKLVILILVVYATVTLVSLRQQINEKNEQEAILNSSIASTRQENNRLQDSIDALGTDEGVAAVAQDKLGMVFDGVISGVTEWGLYVELNENKCEGLVPIRDLDDDYYEFDEKNYCLLGRRKKRQYRLGDPITIKVAQANLERKQLDFQLAE